MKKQPTALSFAKGQEAWAKHRAAMTDQEIEAREAVLRKRDIPPEEWDQDDELMELFDNQLFFERYAEEMADQQDYLREKYLAPVVIS